MQTSTRIYRAKQDWKFKSRNRAISNRKMVESSTMPIYKAFDEFVFIIIASVVFIQLHLPCSFAIKNEQYHLCHCLVVSS